MSQKNRSPLMTEDLAAKAKWMWLNTPLNQAQISAVLGAVNQGRISEVVNGYRFTDVDPEPCDGWQSYV